MNPAVCNLRPLRLGAFCALLALPVALPAQTADSTRNQRVDRLVAQMTLQEKVAQMQNHAAAIPRLGVPAYDYWSEALHGSARSGYSTLFPQAIGLAATWDTPLLHQVATVISTEARAKYNHAIAEDNHSTYFGLTLWSPNINIFRDPRWGRGQETYGEDPFLTSRMGVAFVTGLQGDDPTTLRTIATPKHFAVHSGPETSRHRFNVDPSPHDLEDTYLPAFRATVTEGHAQSLMCAYNSVDGAPACANPMLLQKTLRGAWGFHGFITSDCGAIGDIARGHAFTPDLEHAAVAAVRAGTDINCGREEYDHLVQAVHDGLIQESEIDTAVRRLFRARFSLGMFDAPSQVAYARLPFSEVDSAAHRELALHTALESMVLLKNERNVLPLAANLRTVAVVGPNAASLAALEGNYNAIPSHPVTPLDGLRDALRGHAKVLYAQGAGYAEGVMVPAPETLFASGPEHGLRAEYFSGETFTGKPALTRLDRQIDFDWNAAAPAPGVNAKSFAVRWTGTLTAPAPGDYAFSISLADCSTCDEASGYAVSLDGKRIAEVKGQQKSWRPTMGATFHIQFADTLPHAFRLEYTHAAPLFGAGITLNWQPPVAALRAAAVEAAQKSDIVVAFVGLSPHLEGEEMPIKVPGFDGGDRTDLNLPAEQQQMLEAVAATGKPLVVVLINGSALAVNWAQQHAAAILEAWYPGEAGGTAIADTLLGRNNPAGRLPVTFYASIDQLPPFDDYSMRDRTYRYSHATPLYRFGDGLSYTHFRYSGAHLSTPNLAAGDPLTVTVTVTNTGKLAGDEVVEVYLTPPPSDLAPLRALVGFQRLHLAPAQSRTVTLPLDPRQLSQVDAAGARAVLPGSYQLFVGGSQPAPGQQGLRFAITGTQSLPK
jgi:beta-glucosidase